MKSILLIVSIFFCFSVHANYWDHEIELFEQYDHISAPPDSPILFIGSSTIRPWNTKHYFTESDRVINRGFGGSQVKDLLDHYNRIILRYKPRAIVLYSGDNDLDFGKPVEEVFQDFKQLLSKINRELNIPVLWFTPKKSPGRRYLWKKIDHLNAMIFQYFLFQNKLTLIDLNSLFGLPTQASSVYSSDSIHMNDKAYEKMSKVVNHILLREK